MIEKKELNDRQRDFESLRKNNPQQILSPELKENWNNFLEFFPIDKINELKKEDYVLGLDNKNSFCYLVEVKLDKLGNMHGANASKFGIYYGKRGSDSTQDYRVAKKFESKNIDESFDNVKQSIITLLEFGKNNDYNQIKDNLLSPMFKGKILFLYYPDKFINIFSGGHLNHFLNELDIDYSEYLDEVDKRTILVNFKNSDPIMKQWTNQEFSSFLYKFYKPPRKILELEDDEKEQEEISKETKELSREEKINYLESIHSISEETISFKGNSYKRNNLAIQLIKELRGDKCQLCQKWIIKKDGKPYIEGAHISPKHKKGSELPENILILCPNHHKEFDLGNKRIINRSSEEIVFQLNNKEYKVNLKIK